jgi:diaminopimelate decarboxylase
VDAFEMRDGVLCCDGVPLDAVATRFGTPTYVYSAAAIERAFAALDRAFATVPHTVCYAVKTNSNLAVLGTLVRAGAGFDIVSGGELARVLRAGAPPARVVFAGVGKTADEMRAGLDAGIAAFNVESRPEAALLSDVARDAGRTAPVALRVTPQVHAGGHAYITTGTTAEKFGIPLADAVEVWEELAARPGLELRGLHCHVGSQILDVAVHAEVATRIADLVHKLRERGHAVRDVNVGGGFGIRYRDETPPAPDAVAAAILPAVRDLGVHLWIEPGRFLVGNAGVLLTRVLYRKSAGDKRFVVVDAGMNDLLRPSLYGAHHDILAVRAAPERRTTRADVVGPLCESGDFLARDREVPDVLAGDFLAVAGAGAYGFAMSSNYNSRPRGAEVLVRDGQAECVRARESLEDLVRGERDWPPAVPA